MIFWNVLRNQVTLTEKYTDFNGVKIINGPKRKNYCKFFLYTGEKTVSTAQEALKVIDKVDIKDESIIFYSDSNQKIAFFKGKKSFLTEKKIEKIIIKIELTPAQRLVNFKLFKSILLMGIIRVKYTDYSEIKVSLGYGKEVSLPVHYLFSKKIRDKVSKKTTFGYLLLNFMWVEIPKKDILTNYLETSQINIPVYLKIIEANAGFEFYYPCKKNSADKYNKKHYLYNSYEFKMSKTIRGFVRKSITGQLVFVNTTKLSVTIKLKEILAYLYVKLFSLKAEKDIYFEKFCEDAKESAYELFKYSKREGNKKSFYILAGNSAQFAVIRSKYGSSILKKNSLRSFIAIFSADKLISSDLPSHLQRRLYDNDYFIKKIILDCKKKIFLQHGPSLATNIFERGYFNRRVPISPNYIVVNSEYEKKLFNRYTSYIDSELWFTGIPNMDIYVKSRELICKDEITFLLTWRPWDLTGEQTEESYIGRYLSFMAVVEHNVLLRNKKVNYVLHPKVMLILKTQFPDIYERNKPKLFVGDIADVLMRTKVLVSDYSSVVFYAFSGGSNVIFYWEDKELCEKMYGSQNILQESNVFGEVCYDINGLAQLILQVFEENNNLKYNRKFANLVETTEGNNTEKTYLKIKEL